MVDPRGPQLAVIADPGLVAELTRRLQGHGAPAHDLGPLPRPGRLTFDLGPTRALVTVAAPATVRAVLAPALAARLQRGLSEGAVVQGPFGRVRFTARPGLSEACVHDGIVAVTTTGGGTG